MAIPITIPRLGWNMEQGVFVGWLKADGTTIRSGEALFTLESEKATENVECLDTGILHIPAHGPRQGDTVAVGAIIGYLLQPGETIPEPATPCTVPPRTAPSSTGVEPLPFRATAHTHDRPASSPRARRAAARLGINWMQATGTGCAGRIRECDVLALAGPTDTPAAASIGSLRRIIAERMLASHRSTASVTLTTTIDTTELVQWRQRWKAGAARDAVVPSYTDLFVKLAASALGKHPALNARWENDRIVTSERIHVGIAVDTNAGLLVPVIRDVPHVSLLELCRRARDLIERAQLGKLSASELRGGTFTVTSLGAFGIDAFTPIINPPECAILGIGRIRRCPAVFDDQIVIRDQVTLSLTFDHRILDGAPAARFLQTLAGLVENPDKMLEPNA
jgi:pyruvate dehydrogenase E2 component (dihydrolipoamide acetyltransferase)